MKFETVSNKPDHEVKALIHADGSLLIQTDAGVVAFDSDGANVHRGDKLSIWLGMAKEKFYEGDKITITF